jgi:hypothetical protein
MFLAGADWPGAVQAPSAAAVAGTRKAAPVAPALPITDRRVAVFAIDRIAFSSGSSSKRIPAVHRTPATCDRRLSEPRAALRSPRVFSSSRGPHRSTVVAAHATTLVSDQHFHRCTPEPRAWRRTRSGAISSAPKRRSGPVAGSLAGAHKTPHPPRKKGDPKGLLGGRGRGALSLQLAQADAPSASNPARREQRRGTGTPLHCGA